MAQPDYGPDNIGVGQGVQNVQGAASQGQAAINQFNPTDVAGTQRQQTNQLYGGQLGTGPTTAGGYLGAYANQVAANPQMQQAYQTAGNIYNVPQLTQQAAYLQGQMAAQPSQQYAISRGFDVGDPQVQNQINVAERFLGPQAQLATQQAQAAQGLQQGYVTQQQAQNQMNLLPIQSYAPFLQQAQQNQFAGLNAQQANEFQALTAKMNAGVQLSQTEMQQYTALAQAQEAYAQLQVGANAQIQAAKIGQQFQTVGPGQNLVNTFANTIVNPAMLTGRTGVATYG